MDPNESRSITIQTGVSAVKTLSIFCRVFVRFLACNEVLINNSWLPLIFNGSLLHGSLLGEGVGGRSVGEERTNLKILNYSYQRFMVDGSRGKRRRQMWELVVSNCLAWDRPLLLYPRGRKPKWPISNPPQTVGCAICQL